ncbi:hypothetical protein Tco_0093580, partial [Tanacetum coccineum]
FIESLQYQQEENAEIGRTSVHTEDEIKAYEGQEQSMEASDSTGGGLDSPRYHMGPQTQVIVFETANKLYKESEHKNMFEFSEIPSFSLGLTQDEYDMGPKKHQEVVNISEKGVEAFLRGKNESSFSIDREENKVKARQEPLDSPFYISVVNVDKVENNKEKRLANTLFKKMAGNDSDVLFKTKYGNQSLRGQIKTLGPDIGKWKCDLDVEGYLKNRVYDVILMVVIVRICYEPRSIVLGFEMEF